MVFVMLLLSQDYSFKLHFWNALAKVIKLGRKMWVYLGDFNYIIGCKEKFGGHVVTLGSNFHLWQFMIEVGTLNLGFKGNLE